MAAQPFFVVGSGRSGTTLLRLILSGHSQLHVVPETWFIRPLVAALPLQGPLTPQQIDTAIFTMASHYRWPDMNYSEQELRLDAAQLVGPALVDLINLVYARQLRAASKRRVGDKTPNYIHIVPELAALYPAAKFIHLIRDGRDVAISFVERDWERYYERRTFPWTLAMSRRRDLAKLPVSSQILEVRYEDLTRDSESSVRRICAFLGEAYEPAMLEWQTQQTLIPARERHIHEKLARPASSESIGVWKTKLSWWECFLIEACLHDDLLDLGYDLKYRATAVRPLLKSTRGLMNALAPALRRGIPYLQRRHLLPKSMYV